MHSVGDNPSESSLQNTFSKYVSMLLYFVKLRSQVYIFPWSTLISVLIASNGNPDLWITGNVVFGIYFIALATYIYNDITDMDLDKINAANRPIVSGKISKRSATALFMILTSVALALNASINIQTAMVALACVALGVIYSHPRTHFKDKFPFKTLITAGGAGLASIIGGFAVGNLSPYVIFASLLFFLYFFILGPLGDIDDLRGDRMGRRRTFPIVLGVRPTLALILSIPIAIMLSTIFIHEMINISLPGLLLIIGVCAVSLAFLYPLIRRWNDRPYVQTTRHKVRFMHVLLQLALLVGVFHII